MDTYQAEKSRSAAEVFEQRRLKMLAKANQVQEDSLASTQRSLAMINESEKIGCEMGQSLVAQGEQLRRVDGMLDESSMNLRESHKHLKAMKPGFFNGIRSLFRSTDKAQQDLSAKQSKAKMSNSLSANNMRDESQLESTIKDYQQRSHSTQLDTKPQINVKDEFTFDDPTKEYKRPRSEVQFKERSTYIEEQLDRNLGDLQNGLGRLKNLALGLGKEIDEQNEYLDVVAQKAERVNDTIKFQSKQMQKHL